MDLHEPEAPATVMSTGRVICAVKLLTRSLPIITRLMQKLEFEIGYALLARNGPSIMSTDARLPGVRKCRAYCCRFLFHP